MLEKLEADSLPSYFPMSEEYVITVEENPSIEDERAIGAGLNLYNVQQTGRKDSNYRKLVVLAKDESNRVVGGLVGGTYWNWFYVDLFWLEDEMRGKGYGARILNLAEREAARRGCAHVFLDTFSFQARPFYEKHGYRVFGTLDDFPPGHKRYFLQKDLEQTKSKKPKT
jgi:GNAT superfamily N-acetyltransferase